EYQTIIANADKLFTDKSYTLARTEYSNASALKPAESYPKEKITLIDNLLAGIAAQKATDEKYQTAVANADKLMLAKTYDQARIEYVKAGEIKPDEQYPKTKIGEIDKILADLAALKSLDEKYSAAIAGADQLMLDKTYEKARTAYEDAGKLKPSDNYPKTKIAEIDHILQSMATQKALDEQYTTAIRKGDSLLALKVYETSRSAYRDALKIRPEESYPKEKIAEISLALEEMARKAKLDNEYQTIIANADKLFTDKSYTLARTEYSNALALKPAESYPKEKITVIDNLLAGIAAQKATDEKYQTAVANADKLMLAKTYDQARAEYIKAGDIKPDEQYPKTKIGEIDKILADLAALKSLDEKYSAAIAGADQLMLDKTYEKARTAYEDAGKLKPSEIYPKTKLAEIDRILQSLATQKALDEQYATKIRKGDSLLALKVYETSRSAYQDALKIRPEESYPKEKIAEISQALEEMARKAKLDNEYQTIIANADKLFTDKSYTLARTEYSNASALKPTESYPKERITVIDNLLAGIAAQKATDEKYQAVVANADKLMLAKTYDQARIEYVKAGDIKPDEQYPKTKIGEIDKILANQAALKSLNEKYAVTIAKADQLLTSKTFDQAKSEYGNASAMKPEEKYPKEKINQIDSVLASMARQKALDEEYSAVITDADTKFSSKSFELAKTGYLKALALKPGEQYPEDRIAETDKALTDAARLKAIDAQYTAALGTADKLLNEKSYEQAKTAYIDAGKIKPGEQYPKDKVSEITAILLDLAQKKSLDEKYKGVIDRADQFFTSKNWDMAKQEYGNARKLKPTEQYPADKILEIDGIVAEIKAVEDNYKNTITRADQLFTQKKYEDARTEYQNALVVKPEATYPKERLEAIIKALEELLGKQKLYENLLASGDNSLKDKDYVMAKDNFQQALSLFPQESYPKDRLNLITARMDSLYRANKALYDKAVAEGDKFFNSFEFDKAVDAFTQAMNFLPMENYPREMIVKIRRTIAENAIADVLNSPVTIVAGDEKQFSFSPVNIAARKNNFVYLKMKNLSNKPFNILMRYGKDKQPNGGVVIRNLSTDGKVNERLVSVKDQDLWYRADNNWISLYPQGGDIEVSFIQVSRAK
ncbi:MAG: hypothetical protein M0Q38_08200, partial [Bacteroidales bacterium]|nr:hypothetical protein [Bacteroidales bacterium]